MITFFLLNYFIRSHIRLLNHDLPNIKKTSQLRIMSTNLLVRYKAWGGRPVKPRASLFLSLVDKTSPDVICVQEMCMSWFCILSRHLPKRYRIVQPLRSYISVRMTNLIYDSDRFILRFSKSVRFKKGLIPQTRRMTYAMFEDKSTHKTFIVVSTHLSLIFPRTMNKDLKIMKSQAKELIKLVSELKKYQCPIYIGGDFNAKERLGKERFGDASEIYDYLSTELTDARYNTTEYHHGKGRRHNTPMRDHIFSTEKSVNHFYDVSLHVLDSMSDHYPIFIDTNI